MVRKIRWGRVFLLILATVAFVLALGYVTIVGVVNASFRYAPPTDAELREDPSLVKFLPDGDPRIEVYEK